MRKVKINYANFWTLTESLMSKRSQVGIFFRGILQFLRRKSPFDWAENFSLLHKKLKKEIFSRVNEAMTIFYKSATVWAWGYVSLPQLRFGVQHYVNFYNAQRIHSALQYKTPDEVYSGTCNSANRGYITWWSGWFANGGKYEKVFDFSVGIILCSFSVGVFQRGFKVAGNKLRRQKPGGCGQDIRLQSGKGMEHPHTYLHSTKKHSALLL